MRSVALVALLALALAGCGKYGPPVRTPQKSAAPTVVTPNSEANRDEEQKESKQ